MAATRRPMTLAAAAATAVALGASVLTLPALAADGGGGGVERPASPKLELKDGTLQWGVKESFRKYVTGMARGRIEAAGGATQAAENGVFTFSDGKGTYDPGTHATDTAFKGSVRFTSTLHKFDISIADVKVRTKGKTGAIRADVTLNGAVQNDIDFAQLDLSAAGSGQGGGEGGAMVFKDIPATLTEKGAKAFDGMYEKGEKLDPATLTVTPGEPVPEEPTVPAEPPKHPSPPKQPSHPKHPNHSEPPKRPEATAPAGVVDGSLSWGLKESFRKYISRGGEATVAGGAKKISTGFRFPYAKADLDSDAKKVDASFGGSVRFTYKAHGIDMKFSDLKVRATGAKGTLLADVTTPKGTDNDVKFAALDLSGVSYKPKNDVVHLAKVPATLTAAGAEQFANDTNGSPYEPGEKLDPVTVALSSKAGATLPEAGGETGDGQPGGTGMTGFGTTGSGTTGSGSVGGGNTVGGTAALAATGSSVPSTALLGVAGVALAAGAGAVVAARRRRGSEAV
ncbi:HtaA domain-containing protein [Streptomyces sp. Je 1-369]|uniref:HtaA domain-containing protein n=1 Tax=Streptomyces sp. Je 1-369 TaxID=2966192 RepID=UPI002285A9E3|nr:HtaA domain-containing protein [Streptomyces sp. Je 1-369]WAL95172.1 HtaA domain-containing protein [Streptomyces sp. Je 1-369]